MGKPGRNDLCPCGSGKKFKRCHGSIEVLERLSPVHREVPQVLARAKAVELRREQQQGLGSPIISAELNGYRFITVRNTLHSSKSWKTFHDFLGDYLKIVMGKEWWMGEVAKAPEARHPILQWAVTAYEYQMASQGPAGQITPLAMNGAVAAIQHLSYDLYSFSHHVELQDLFVNRLKNPKLFPGARYEAAVAAILLRAGFTLELEDETDGTSTHVEFVATHQKTGTKFSVEAKQRDADKVRIGRLLSRALKKRAAHPRIVFVDINEPDEAQDLEAPKFMQDARVKMLSYERNPSAAGLPAAIIVVTNSPWHHHLNVTNVRGSALVHGFRIPEMQMGYQFATLRHAVDYREANRAIFDLMRSMKDHSTIPSTFDGENPELSFGRGEARLTIGGRYRIPIGDKEVEAVLESGTVIEQWRAAMCSMCLPDGSRIVQRFELSELELRAWRAHPETFFGVIDRNARRGELESPLEWYDFFFDVYRETSREKLIEWMSSGIPRGVLEGLDQVELARLYSEGLVGQVLKQNRPASSAGSPGEEQ